MVGSVSCQLGGGRFGSVHGAEVGSVSCQLGGGRCGSVHYGRVCCVLLSVRRWLGCLIAMLAKILNAPQYVYLN